VRLQSPRKLLASHGPIAPSSSNRYASANSPQAAAAANAANAAITSTQYAIEAAVDSGADPQVTQDAAFYGAAAASWAASVANNETSHCGWWHGWWYGRC
jgi:hypothetical protein